MNFLVMPIFFLSGALYPLTNLPSAMTIITRINPLSYGVDAVRDLLIAKTNFGLGLDLTVIIALTVILLFTGSYLFEKVQV